MKNFFLLPFCICCFAFQAKASGFDIKTSSIIDQPAIEVLGDYNNSWYIIGFEIPNHPAKPARFYILKYAAGFPTAKSSPVYPPFGEKTDYLKAAIVNGMVSIFYSRTEHLADRPDMVDSRDGYKQIPKILRQDYDPVTLLPVGEPVTVFDAAQEHFAASGIEVAQSEDRSKTAIVIKHYFRQSKFKMLIIDNVKKQEFERTYDLKTDKNLITFRKLVINNAGQILLEAKTQEDPLRGESKSKKVLKYYFFSINIKGEEPAVLSLAAAVGGNQLSDEPMIACMNNGDLVISYDHYTNDHSPVLKGISVTKYRPDFTMTTTRDITPDDKLMALAAPYQKIKERGLEYLETRQLLPLDAGGCLILAEYHHSTENKDKVTGITNRLEERHYLTAYRLDNSLAITSSNLIDKKQSAHNIAYAFSAQAYHLGSDVYLLHNEDCDGDDEHGLYLLSTKLPGNGGDPVTQKIVHTSEDFFTSLEHIYPAPGNRILFTEEKVVDFAAEGRELKLLEIRVK